MTLNSAQPTPLVAIVTPVYNGAEFLDATMKCVQAQTYPNIVHVVLDNASTDQTPAIVEAYRNGSTPMIVGRNDVLLSMDENWNAALKLIPPGTAYFTILCADDVLMPEAIARMVALAESDREIAIVSAAAFRNQEEVDFRWPKDRTVFDGDEAIRRYFTISGVLEARQILWRTEALSSAVPFFDLDVGQSSDIDAGLRLLVPGKLGFVHDRLMMIREHEANVSNSEMRPLNIHFNDWLITLRRHGPRGFGDKAYREIERRYRRHYFRQLLKWRLRKCDRQSFDLHMTLLTKIRSRPGPIDFAVAAFDLVLIRLGLRKGWYSYPA
ncbi:MAG: glycosyltransferase family 2 protein [Hyphomonadaceae bacterium]|nr:glycosyltransferase family 2 protein [Hyphomonadaceae bacterium]